jgi:hypothetical protein
MMRLCALFVAFLQGCIYVPRTTTTYDEQCNVNRRQLTLEPTQIAGFGGCAGRDCAYLLVAAGAVAAASVVVSGSIVVVGNVVYWIEREGKCLVG